MVMWFSAFYFSFDDSKLVALYYFSIVFFNIIAKENFSIHWVVIYWDISMSQAFANPDDTMVNKIDLVPFFMLLTISYVLCLKVLGVFIIHHDPWMAALLCLL